ncbi:MULTISPECIES: hypothetical protein [Methylobacterium]|uniref:Lipoprotein n=1 Tax=Methylobacterium longum TaxID=767694 RepID=A0ABT8AU66_9HYPH|nr:MULTISPECIES: hypothetical protein [Methylobacterium]MCJ2100242.1 hypothetical protein [Methylobacterium sp. E-046]MDN3573393.1 hypothetical protein [Methylobacterium longum]GJE14122.1 hypothetical protein FOHLNKBM_5192 [Methylobacterium longum]
MRSTHRWLLAAAVSAGFLGGLAACQDTLRRERVATCRRALPAVVPQADIRLLRAAPGSAINTVRVDYADGDRQRWLTCRFDAGATLVALVTEGANLSGPSLYMLKRFYLDTPDAEAADPGQR